MDAKLIKFKSGYELYDGNEMIGSTYPYQNIPLLSLKNCQAIERGFDFGEIKRKVFSGFDGLPDSFTMVAVEITIEVMIELMGDKKFSEDELKLAFFHVQNEPTFDEFIQSLQQKEWDVYIEMEYIGECNGNNDNGCFQNSPGHDCGCFKREPKLDENGCLILKRK